MDITIFPRPLSGKIPIIASKSEAHRLLICAALSKQETVILCNESSLDIDATARCLNALGADIRRTAEGFLVSPIRKERGTGLSDCGESGSTLRFLLPVAGALGKEVRFVLGGRLPSRPLSPLREALEEHGMTLSWENETTILCRGQLRGGSFSLPANISSQFISGLLFALPLLPEASTLTLTGKIESAAYIDMTLDALHHFGVQFDYKENTYFTSGGMVPSRSGTDTLRAGGDWSNAAFWLVAGAMGEGIFLEGLSPDSLQGDKAILSLLSQFGANVKWEGGSVFVEKAPMHGIEIDASQIPDLVPILAVLALGAIGTTRIRGAERLKLKESDRLETVYAMLSNLGGDIEKTADGLIIKGGKPLHGGTVDSFGDHRIAMSAAICSALCKGAVTIKGADAVQKSYPKFWEHFALLGGEIERSETK